MSDQSTDSPEMAEGTTPSTSSTPTAEERILLLECRLEKLGSALNEARADADVARDKIAENAAREAEHARRYGVVYRELAEARAEVASLHERLGHSEALRAELEGHFFEAGDRGDAAELVRLRREVLAQRQRSLVSERTSSRLRARVDELLMSRDALLSRVATWQQLIRKEGPEAVDLAEFISELRSDILILEHQSETADRQEAALRDRMVRAGLDPDAPLEDVVSAESLDEAGSDTMAAAASDAVDQVGPEREDQTATAPADPPALDSSPEDFIEESASERAGSNEAVESLEAMRDVAFAGEEAIARAELREPPPSESGNPEHRGSTGPTEELDSPDPSERADAFQRMARRFDSDPNRLASHLRAGLADPHPRVRRRVVLTAATVRNLAIRQLLEPLQDDPDLQVRRVVREVLRHAPPLETGATDEETSGQRSTGVLSATMS